jgi:hypothetical protein
VPDRAPAPRLDLLDRGGDRGLVAIEYADGGAGPSEADRGGAPDPRPATGDECRS